MVSLSNRHVVPLAVFTYSSQATDAVALIVGRKLPNPSPTMCSLVLILNQRDITAELATYLASNALNMWNISTWGICPHDNASVLNARRHQVHQATSDRISEPL
jgi:hypothetical protein